MMLVKNAKAIIMFVKNRLRTKNRPYNFPKNLYRFDNFILCMLPKYIVDELKNEFKDNELASRMISSFFEENSTNLKPLIDHFVEEKLNEINKS